VPRDDEAARQSPTSLFVRNKHQKLSHVRTPLDQGLTVRIPLIEELTTGPVPQGTNLLVEFDPASQWFNASLTIVVGWIKGGGKVSYSVSTQPPESIRLKLKRQGLDPKTLEEEGKLRIWDWYTAALGQKSNEPFAIGSMKVSDLSIFYSQEQLRGPPLPTSLNIIDDGSILARFNEEKNWVEFSLTRIIPMAKFRNTTIIASLIKGVHSDWVYKRFEAAADGVVDFKLDETSDPAQNLIRLRSMKDIGFDARWHRIKLQENQQVTLEE